MPNDELPTQPSPIDASKTEPLDAMTRARIILDVCLARPDLTLANRTGNQMPFLTDAQILELEDDYVWFNASELRKAFPIPGEEYADYLARYATIIQ